MGRYKISPKLIIGLIITIFIGISLIFRIVLPYNDIFGGGWIKFSSIDGYYYMRLVDSMVHNFPHFSNFDPFLVYPGGMSVGDINLFYRILSGFIWIIGLGSPTQHTIDMVGAYFPPILGALTIIPVYFIAKTLFNRWAGIIAVGLIAIFPGEFLGRSILGFGDTPVVETFLTATSIAFLMLAIKTAVQRQLTYGHLIQRNWGLIVRPLVLALLAGVFLGVYLATWLGGLIFVFIISLYFIIQFVIDHLRRKPSDYLGIVGFVVFLVAFLILLPFSKTRDVSFAMLVAVFIPVVLSAVSLLISRKGIRPFYYPISLVGLAIILVGGVRIIDPSTLNVLLIKFSSVFLPTGATAATTLEMQRFLYPQGTFNTSVAWGNFTTSFFLIPWDWGPGNIWFPPGFALISFVIMVVLFIKRRSDDKNMLLLFIWTLVTFMITLVQRRFSYYLVVNFALLSAYISWLAIWYAGLRKLAANPEQKEEIVHEASGKTKAGKRDKEQRSPGTTIYCANTALAIIVVFFFVFFPNLLQSKVVASEARFAPPDAWQESLLWMKDNTPEPLGDPEAYYELYTGDYKYPESAYGVTSWWDYGYWISRTAHRLPSANPSQDPVPITKIANLLLSQDESSAGKLMEELESSYIVADHAMTLRKFWAIVTWAGKEQTEFIGVYQLTYQGKSTMVQLFHPAYYRSLLARLYNFNCQAVTESNPMVVSYSEKTDRAGNKVRQVINIEEFDSYQDALEYVESNGSDNLQIVGINQFVSPVPLEAVKEYKLVHASQSVFSDPGVGMIPEVKIFEYTSPE